MSRRLVAKARPVCARRVAYHENASEADCSGEFRTTNVALRVPPTGTPSDLEAIGLVWWMQSSGYPVGRSFHTITGSATTRT